MALYSLSRQRIATVGPPAINWRWNVFMPQIDGIQINTSLIIAESIDFPFLNINSIPRFSGGKNVYYPSTADIAPIPISFYENEAYIVNEYLTAWQRLVRDQNTGFYGVAADYKKEIYLSLYDINDNLRLTGVMYNCWPTERSPLSFNYTESGRVVVTCTFQTDETRLRFPRYVGSNWVNPDSQPYVAGNSIFDSVSDRFNSAVDSVVSAAEGAIDSGRSAISNIFGE